MSVDCIAMAKADISKYVVCKLNFSLDLRLSLTSLFIANESIK